MSNENIPQTKVELNKKDTGAQKSTRGKGELSEQELEKASGGGAYPPSPCGKIG
jgi:hypothetical protein